MHGTACHFCLDVDKSAGAGKVDLYDCKPQDGNQVWGFDVQQGAAPVRNGKGKGGLCLAYGG